MSDDLLSEIRAFLSEQPIRPSYFGWLAAKNTRLVERLEAGDTITIKTADRVRAFMAKRRAEADRRAGAA